MGFISNLQGSLDSWCAGWPVFKIQRLYLADQGLIPSHCSCRRSHALDKFWESILKWGAMHCKSLKDGVSSLRASLLERETFTGISFPIFVGEGEGIGSRQLLVGFLKARVRHFSLFLHRLSLLEPLELRSPLQDLERPHCLKSPFLMWDLATPFLAWRSWSAPKKSRVPGGSPESRVVFFAVCAGCSFSSDVAVFSVHRWRIPLQCRKRGVLGCCTGGNLIGTPDVLKLITS